MASTDEIKIIKKDIERHNDTLDSLVQVVTNVQSAVNKMRKSVDEMQIVIQSSISGAQDKANPSRSSTESTTCQCKSLKKDILNAMDNKFNLLRNDLEAKYDDKNFSQKITKQMMDFTQTENKDLLKEIRENSKSIKKDTLEKMKKENLTLKQEVKNLQTQITPVMNEVLKKTIISMYSDTRLAEKLDAQIKEQTDQGFQLTVVKNRLTSMEQEMDCQMIFAQDCSKQSAERFEHLKSIIEQHYALPELLNRRESLDNFRDLKQLIQNNPAPDNANYGAAAASGTSAKRYKARDQFKSEGAYKKYMLRELKQGMRVRYLCDGWNLNRGQLGTVQSDVDDGGVVNVLFDGVPNVNHAWVENLEIV